MIQKIKGDVLMEEKPGLRFLMDTDEVLAPDRWDVYHVGSSTPDLFTKDPYYPLQLKYFGETAMRGSFFVAYGGWDRDHDYKMEEKSHWNKLLRTLTSWEMLHRTPVADRIFDADKKTYLSPTATADLHVTAGVHPDNGAIYAVFHDTDARLHLADGVTPTTIRQPNAYWEPTEDATDRLVVENGIVRPADGVEFPVAAIIDLEGQPKTVFTAAPGVTLEKTFSVDNLYEKDIYDPGFEEGGVGWVSGGEAQVRTVTDPVFEGGNALEIYDRGKAWHGASQNITGFLMSHLQGTYEVSAQVRPKDYADEFRIGIQFIERGDTKTLFSDSVTAQPGEWTKVSATFDLDWNDWIERGTLDIRRTDANDPFYLDDVQIRQTRKGRGL